MKLSDELYLFNEGRNFQAYRLLGAHPDQAGTTFRVWAPNAAQVSVIGDFNAWQGAAHGMHELGASGIWELLVPEAAPHSLYRFQITNRDTGDVLNKAGSTRRSISTKSMPVPGCATPMAGLMVSRISGANWPND